MTHGLRSIYQATGCRCTPCRAANAAYEAAYRDRKRRGLPLLGSVVSAVETWRQLRLLTTEYEGEAALAIRLGARNGDLQLARRLGGRTRVLKVGSRVTLRTALIIQRRYQFDILAGLETGVSA